jgi:FkbM family methyltransferase
MTTTLRKGTLVDCHFNGIPLRFFVANDLDIIQRHHLRGAFYEQEELAIIAEYFNPGDFFVDAGANVGNHTVYVAKFLKPGGMMVFEPNPEAVAILRANISLNDLCEIVDVSRLGVGLSDGPGAASLKHLEHNLGGTRLITGADNADAVPLATADSMIGERRVDFMKIDVESMEMTVLAGLKATIARSRPRIFIEIIEHEVGRFTAWAEANGYAIVKTYRRYQFLENYLIVPKERVG